jgi:hypothetical protein
MFIVLNYKQQVSRQNMKFFRYFVFMHYLKKKKAHNMCRTVIINWLYQSIKMINYTVKKKRVFTQSLLHHFDCNIKKKNLIVLLI